ncbi:MAG: hypothetical protein AAF745_04100 [Planctomycetota bacterium]
MNVTDVDVRTLRLELASSVVNEDGITSVRVILSDALTNDLLVSLSSCDSGEATILASPLVIMGGETEVTFTINGVLDAVADGNQSVTLTASAGPLADATATLTVADVDSVNLAIDVDSISIAENGSTTGTVSLSTASTQNIVVTLS